MRCLSFRQPWLDLLISGPKTIDVRHWNTRHRGPLLLHSSRQVDKEALDDFVARNVLDKHYTPTLGAVLASGELEETFRYGSSVQFNNDAPKHLNPHIDNDDFAEFDFFGWAIASVRALAKPVPLRGQLGLFNANYDLQSMIGC